MFDNFFTKLWYGKTLSCRTSLKSGTAAAVPAAPTGDGAAHGHATALIGPFRLYIVTLDASEVISQCDFGPSTTTVQCVQNGRLEITDMRLFTCYTVRIHSISSIYNNRQGVKQRKTSGYAQDLSDGNPGSRLFSHKSTGADEVLGIDCAFRSR